MTIEEAKRAYDEARIAETEAFKAYKEAKRARFVAETNHLYLAAKSMADKSTQVLYKYRCAARPVEVVGAGEINFNPYGDNMATVTVQNIITGSVYQVSRYDLKFEIDGKLVNIDGKLVDIDGNLVDIDGNPTFISW